MTPPYKQNGTEKRDYLIKCRKVFEKSSTLQDKSTGGIKTTSYIPNQNEGSLQGRRQHQIK